MANAPLFDGLVFSEDGKLLIAAQVGDEPFYVLNDAGFLRHIRAREVDESILRWLWEQIRGHEKELAEQAARMTGQEDLRSVGNVSLATAIVSSIYTILFITGGPVLEGGEQLVAPSKYLAMGCAGYAALTYMVWLNAFGKFPAKALAWSLIIWVVVGLWIPGFWLMAAGKLPF